MQTLVTWFQAHIADLPREPFWLGVGLHVAHPAHFYARLQREIARGPMGPRARSGVLEDELMALMERWAIQHDGEGENDEREDDPVASPLADQDTA